jgi:hypothetical protein
MGEVEGWPQAFFGLVVCLLVSAALLFGVYWAVRLAVRDGLDDRDERRPGGS